MSKRIISAMLAFTIIFSCCPVFADNDVKPAYEEVLYKPTQDTYVSEKITSNIYGLDNRLMLSAVEGEQRKIYLAFRIKGDIGEYDKVELRFTASSAEKIATKQIAEDETVVMGAAVSKSAVHEWFQTKLNWDNAHKSDGVITNAPITAGEEVCVDVSEYVKSSRSDRGYIGFVLEASDKENIYTIPSIESGKDGYPAIYVIKDVLTPDTEEAEEIEKPKESNEQKLQYELVKTKYPDTPDLPALPADLDIDEYTATYHKPWMVNYHYVSPTQIAKGYYGGDAGQMGWTMAYNPHKPDQILLGTDTEGIWRSENGGVSWLPSCFGLELIGNTSLAYDPYDEGVVYAVINAGTKHESDMCGIYKSTDEGNTWKKMFVIQNTRTKSYHGLDFGKPDKNGNHRIFYVSNKSLGLYCSDDKGVTWKELPGFAGIDTKGVYVIDGTVAVVSTQQGLSVSYDNGETFTQVKEGLEFNEDGSPMYGGMALAGDPTNPNIWMYLTGSSRLYMSTDAGKSFEFVSDNSAYDSRKQAVGTYLTFGAPKEDGTSILYVAASRQRSMKVSEDYGKTFTIPVHYNTDAWLVDNWGWGVEPLVTHPTDPYTAFVILDGEPYVTHDGGKTLKPSSSGYSGNRLIAAAFKPDGSEFFWGHTDRGILHSMYSGRGEEYPILDSYMSEDRFWIRNPHKSIDGIDVNWETGEVWTGIGDGFSYSKDFGRTYEKIFTSGGTGKVNISKQNPDLIYMGKHISRDHGKTWEDAPYTIMECSPVDGNIVYARVEACVYRSKDAGVTWQQLTASPIKYAQGITCDWNDPDKAYIGCNNAIYVVDGDEVVYKRVTNDGFGLGTGAAILNDGSSGGSTFYGVAQDSQNPDHLVVGDCNIATYAKTTGVYESWDGGNTWTFVPGMEGTRDTRSIHAHPTESKFYIGTSNGTWVYDSNKYYDMSNGIYLDVTDENPHKEIIEKLYNDGYWYQFHRGYFYPDGAMTREKFAEMIKLALDLEQTKYMQAYADVDRYNISYVTVQALYENGVISDTENGLFRPREDITYDEVAAMLYGAVKAKHIPDQGSFSEMMNVVGDSVSSNVRYAVYQLKLLGIITDEITFKSGEVATNTDIALMFNNLLNLIK